MTNKERLKGFFLNSRKDPVGGKELFLYARQLYNSGSPQVACGLQRVSMQLTGSCLAAILPPPCPPTIVSAAAARFFRLPTCFLSLLLCATSVGKWNTTAGRARIPVYIREGCWAAHAVCHKRSWATYEGKGVVGWEKTWAVCAVVVRSVLS